MKPTLLILLLLLVVVVGYGQQQPLSPKYQQKLDKITDPYKKVMKYERYKKKDSLRAERLKKQVKTQAKKMVKDSLNNIPELTEHNKALSQALDLDSASIRSQVNQLGTEAIHKETGLEISTIPTDSTQVRDQANQVTKDQIPTGCRFSEAILRPIIENSDKSKSLMKLCTCDEFFTRLNVKK